MRKDFEIINNSRFRLRTIDKIVRFALRGFRPYLKNTLKVEVCDYYYKMANGEPEEDEDLMWGGEAVNDELIRVFINPKIKYPIVLEANYTPRTRYISGQFIRTRIELLLLIFSHELLHCVQHNFKDPIILSHIINLDDESQCDIFGMIKLDQWRRLQNKKKNERKRN